MAKAATKVLATSEPDGNVNAVRNFSRQARGLGAEAIALLGSLTPRNSDPKLYGHMLKALAEGGLPAFYIPGPEDAPFAEFLQEAVTFEIIYPHLRGVHGTFALDHGHVLWSGWGGVIDDGPRARRDETESLTYPAWEVEYRLKCLRDLKDYEKVFLFTSAPGHKGMHEKGSSVLAGIINTHIPRVVLIAGREQKQETIGRSQIVIVGSIAEGNYSFIDLRKRETTAGTLDATVKVA
jgi:hypothetical protein